MFYCTIIFQALELLPPSIKIKDILGYLENVLELKSATKHQSQVLRNMLFSESLQVCSSLNIFILMYYPIHIDTISMELSILNLRGCWSNFLKMI